LVRGTTATSAFSYTYSTFEGGATNTVYTGQLGLSHQITPLDTATLNYTISAFESPGTATQVANTPTVGWTRQFTPRTTLMLWGGPSFVEGSVFPSVSAQLTHELKLFDKVVSASLGYAYSQGFVVGQAGLQNTQTASGSISVEPIRSLVVSLAASASRFESGPNGTSPTTTTYGVGLNA